MADREPPLPISGELDACRQDAAAVAKRHQKGSSRQLYAVLTRAMRICERCALCPADLAEVDRLIRAQPTSGKGRWTLQGSDVYTLVCRYVFADTCLGNASRYAATLRQAAGRQISSDALFEQLADRGGVSALFLERPLDARSVEARTLRLDRAVTFPKDGAVVLTLARGPDGVFVVLNHRIAASAERIAA